jgi:hypothetical protein
MKRAVTKRDTKSIPVNQIRKYWRSGSATCLREVKLTIPPRVYDWFVSQLIVDEMGCVTEFMNNRSGLINQFGPRRWSVILDLEQMRQIAEDLPGFAPVYISNFLKRAVARRCNSLLLENFDATIMSEWTEV